MFPAIGVVLLLLAAAFLFARIALYAGLPAPAAIVLVGIAANGMLPHELRIELTPTTLAVFLPALIFEGAWNIDVRSLVRSALPILVLAVPGVLITATAIASAGLLAGGMALSAAFALGAMLSATDPVAVLALFRTLPIPLDLRTLVEGESIANDGVAIALYGIALALSQAGTTIDVWAISWKAIIGVLGGIGIGVAAAAIIGLAIRGARERSVELTATIVLAYSAYGVATSLECSGVFASAAAGITLRAMRGFVLTAQAPEDIDRFWEVIAFVANAVVFLATGLLLQIQRLLHEPLLVGAAIVVVFASRAILTFGVLPALGVGTLHPGWRATVFCAGMRGALALALVIGLPANFPDRSEIIDATFAIVLVTLVVQGATIEPFLKRLPLQR
jgi:CPA1 family monovalent cation:H+ antiporter